MSAKKSLILGAAFAALAAGGAAAMASAEAGVPEHRIIYRGRSPLLDSWDVGYWVSVERYLTEQDLKKLVCAVVDEEKPDDYIRLTIVFNYRLDSFNLVVTQEYIKSRLARYGWSENLGGNPYSLARWRDENGVLIPRASRFTSFDHTKQCPFAPSDESSGGTDRDGSNDS